MPEGGEGSNAAPADPDPPLVILRNSEVSIGDDLRQLTLPYGGEELCRRGKKYLTD